MATECQGELWVSGAIDLGDGGCEEEGDGSDYASCYDNSLWLGFGVGGGLEKE